MIGHRPLTSSPAHARTSTIRSALALTALAGFAVAGASQSSRADEPWAPSVHARYTLRYNGIPVGYLDVTTTTTARTYAVSGNGEVSVLLGAIKWVGSASVSGAIENGTARPKTYAFEWHKNSKGGAIKLGYNGPTAINIAVEPPPNTGPEVVPIKPEHKTGFPDPLSAILNLTRADSRGPCDRRAAIFDGKQRYDLAFSLKRHTRIAPSRYGGASTIGYVCQASYVPIAGHRDNADNKGYIANHDSELVMRPVPGAKFWIPYSVSIPTKWGTGSMTTDHVEITTPTGTKVALTD